MEQIDKPETNETEPKIGSPNTPDNFVEGAGIDLSEVRVGYSLEAASFDGKWYFGKIVFVDESDETFLVHFDGWNTRFDEWYKYTSKKVRPLPPHADPNRKKVAAFRPGDNVLAKWIDNKFYMCHVVRTRPGDKYEVRFEDGVLHTVEVGRIRNADRIDEFTESARLLKQQENIERAKSRELRLHRRSKLNNDTTTITPLIPSNSNVMVSDVVELEEGMNLSVCIPLSGLYLNSCERNEDTPSLTLFSGNTYSVKSFSSVLGPDLEYLAEPDSDVISTAPSTPLSGKKDITLRKRRDPPSLSSAPLSSAQTEVTLESDAEIQTHSDMDRHTPPPPPISVNPEVPDSQPPTQVQLLPLDQSPPLLSSYNPPIPYTETVVTADGRVLTLTPSYQPPPPPPPAAPTSDVTAQPLYYQLVPIQVNPSSNPSSIPVEQSYLAVQQPYSYPYQTPYAPVIQQYPSSSLHAPHSMALSTSLQQFPSISHPSNIQLSQDTAYSTMNVQTQETATGYLDQMTQISLLRHNPAPQLYQSATTQPVQTSHDLTPQTDTNDKPREQIDDVISDSESDKALFIDTQPADPQRSDVTEVSTSQVRKNSLSEEETENRELRKLRLPDHNRKVAPRELVTTLESELFICQRSGCTKEFHRRESLKKHMRVFHGSSNLHKKYKPVEKPSPQEVLPLTPVCSPLTSPEPDLVTEQLEFPTSSDHSITHTELLFKNPASSHRSKRKSSQPRKSSFLEPTTPTVTIVIPSDPLEEASQPSVPIQTPPTAKQPPQAAPSRQSKRISIKKNWDFDTNYKTVRKNTKLKDKQDKHELLKKDVRAQMSNPKLQHELREKATLKMKPPKQQIVIPSSAEGNSDRSEQTPLEVGNKDRDQEDTHTTHSDVICISADDKETYPAEQTEVVEEMQTDLVIESNVDIIDMMETSVSENSEIKHLNQTENATEFNPEDKLDKEKYYSSGSEIDDEDSIGASVVSVNTGELIRCVCDQDKDEGVMVQCEQCMTWQHTSCMGLSEKDLPDQHICSECSDPPACIKREQYKHSNPWYHSGKLMFPTDTDIVETGAQLSSLKNQLASLENMLPTVNLKIQIARTGNHPYLKEFMSTNCNLLSPDQIEEKAASLSYLTSNQDSHSQSDTAAKLISSSDNCDQSTQDVNNENTLTDKDPTQTTDKTELLEDDNGVTVENIDPNLTSLMIALNDSEWGCKMRLFEDIEKIQNNLLTQFSSIEKNINSLRYRIPDSDVSSLSETLSKLDSIRTNLS